MFRVYYGANKIEEDKNRKLCTPLNTGHKIWNKILIEIFDILEKESKNDDLLLFVDAFGGIGLDSIAFSKNYKKIFENNNYQMIVFETNSNTFYKALAKNLKNEKHCNLFFKSCLSYTPAKTHSNTLLYFDPPWGPYYNKTNVFNMKEHMISNISIYDSLNMLVDIWKPKWIVVKLPVFSICHEIYSYKLIKSIVSPNKKLIFHLLQCECECECGFGEST